MRNHRTLLLFFLVIAFLAPARAAFTYVSLAGSEIGAEIRLKGGPDLFSNSTSRVITEGGWLDFVHFDSNPHVNLTFNDGVFAEPTLPQLELIFFYVESNGEILAPGAFFLRITGLPPDIVGVRNDRVLTYDSTTAPLYPSTADYAFTATSWFTEEGLHVLDITNPASLDLTGPGTFSLYSFGLSLVAVPEPSTAALAAGMMAGLSALFLRSRRTPR